MFLKNGGLLTFGQVVVNSVYLSNYKEAKLQSGLWTPCFTVGLIHCGILSPYIHPYVAIHFKFGFISKQDFLTQPKWPCFPLCKVVYKLLLTI